MRCARGTDTYASPDEGDRRSLERQWKLMQILEDRRQLAVNEVARELGSTPRTVYRDLSVLERIGVPIYQERPGTRARWRVMERYRSRRFSVTLSWPEMLALSAARDLVGGASGSFFHGFAVSALDKIRRAVPEETREARRRDGGGYVGFGWRHRGW
ncbi:MAG TPA: HTH domain-containing protein [Myxococcaceae bacterium]|nr:HTH domain-containing protein [Myxococcaceae bacterium]